MAILTILGAALQRGRRRPPVDAARDAAQALVAFALFVTSVVLAVAAIANDNLQDLKTGQLVDATPWRQQVALVIGMVAGALVIPPVLDLLQEGLRLRRRADAAISAKALAAPQAALISALAKGVHRRRPDWGLLGKGALLGVVLVVVD